jgi:hypothetical protein
VVAGDGKADLVQGRVMCPKKHKHGKKNCEGECKFSTKQERTKITLQRTHTGLFVRKIAQLWKPRAFVARRPTCKPLPFSDFHSNALANVGLASTQKTPSSGTTNTLAAPPLFVLCVLCVCGLIDL